MSQGIDPETLEESMFDVLVHDLPIRAVIRRREMDVAVSLDRPRRSRDRQVGEDRPRALTGQGVEGDAQYYDFICIERRRLWDS